MPDHRSSIRRHPARLLAIVAIAVLVPTGIRAQSVAAALEEFRAMYAEP